MPVHAAFPLIPALHIPDGFLSLTVAGLFWLLSILFILAAVPRVQRSLGERHIPLMGIMAAFIFAAQMINFPVAGGTSGHLLGGALAAIVLGPWAAILVMTAVVAVQALLFQDGGLVVMGANIFNMGLLTALIGFGVYRSVAGQGRLRQAQSGRRLRLLAAGAAAWLSVLAAALLTTLQLWASDVTLLHVAAPAMLSVHALIGIGEALITVAALGFIAQTRPDLLAGEAVRERGGRGWVAAGALAVLLTLLLSPLASTQPDGLERVAADLGFLAAGVDAPYELLPDYTLPLLATPLSTLLAGAIGAIVVAALVLFSLRLLRRPAA